MAGQEIQAKARGGCEATLFVDRPSQCVFPPGVVERVPVSSVVTQQSVLVDEEWGQTWLGIPAPVTSAIPESWKPRIVAVIWEGNPLARAFSDGELARRRRER